MAKALPETKWQRLFHTPISPSLGSIFVFGSVMAMTSYLLGGIAFPKTAWKSTVAGIEVQYVLTEPNETFNGRKHSLHPLTNTCYIEIAINPAMLERLGAQNYFTYITAHELGHCLDQFQLHNNHGHLTAVGDNLNIYGTGEKGQAETYADAYAVHYIRNCGTILRPLGWPVKDGYCKPPEPQSIKPRDSKIDPIALIMKNNEISQNQSISRSILDPRGINE